MRPVYGALPSFVELLSGLDLVLPSSAAAVLVCSVLFSFVRFGFVFLSFFFLLAGSRFSRGVTGSPSPGSARTGSAGRDRINLGRCIEKRGSRDDRSSPTSRDPQANFQLKEVRERTNERTNERRNEKLARKKRYRR